MRILEQEVNYIISGGVYGSGRPLVMLVNNNPALLACSEKLALEFPVPGQVHRLIVADFGDKWRQALNQLMAYLEASSVRSATFIAFEDCTVLLQALCLIKPRMIRTLVFIDPSTRAQPGRLVKFIEKVEKFLPLGLPFRSSFAGFDGKPFLQRIRSPLLIVSNSDSGSYRKEQARIINEGVPTSFMIELSDSPSFGGTDFTETLKDVIVSFQEVPARCPQKNIR